MPTENAGTSSRGSEARLQATSPRTESHRWGGSLGPMSDPYRKQEKPSPSAGPATSTRKA